MDVSRWKFKNRIVVVAVGAIFTVLLVLESTFLNAISPVAKQTDTGDLEQGSDVQGDGVISKTSVFEGIILNLDAHLSIMRRELAINGEGEPGDEIFTELSQSEETEGAEEVIQHSRVIQKYADTFIKIADILHSSRGDRDSSKARANGDKNKVASGYEENQGVSKAMSSAWPDLGVYKGNVSISNRIHPNGYMKREGRDFVLGTNVTDTLNTYSRILAAKHKKRNSSDWDRLHVYRKSGCVCLLI